MDVRFGSASPGLLQRLRRTPVTIEDLRDAADEVLPGLVTSSLRVRLVDRFGDGAIVVLEEDERRVRVHLAELADAMTRASVAPTHESICKALSSWVAHRPVTDEAAAASGVAVLDWTDPAHTAVGWHVVVVRDGVALRWAPSRVASPEAVERTRAAAVARSAGVELDLRVEGPVALWSHSSVPLLATTALLEPERMLARAAAAGLLISDLHVVVTPGRPVACAGAGVAQRLADDTAEPCVTLPRPALARLSW